MEEEKTWRKCPFEKDRFYLVKDTIHSLSETFHKGEKLKYIRSFYRIYESYTGYEFDTDGYTKILDIEDIEDINEYTKKMEKI